MLGGFCQNLIFGQKFDFSNSVFYETVKAKPGFPFQLTNECAGLNLHSLSAMEEQIAEISSMEGIFKKAMLISAHFKYMAEDWRNGRECNGASGTNLTKAFERYVFYFCIHY